MVFIIGTFIYPPLLFIHVIDDVYNGVNLANIFLAIALATKSLLYVSSMGLVFTIIYCRVTFSNYMHNIYEDAAEE